MEKEINYRYNEDAEIDYRYNEVALLNELKSYIDGTYDEHYSQNKFQATEFIIDSGHGVGFTVGNVIKYAQRYGKKDGRNRKDIFKTLHYALILLHIHDLETKETLKQKNHDDLKPAGTEYNDMKAHIAQTVSFVAKEPIMTYNTTVQTTTKKL